MNWTALQIENSEAREKTMAVTQIIWPRIRTVTVNMEKKHR